MLTFDQALQNALAASISKVDWRVTLLNQLGTDLKIRCKRNPDASSTNVFATGTEFFSASIVGTPQGSGGSVVKFGNITNATINLGVDLTSGASVLRIEGNGHYIEGTLGLSNSASDFKLSQNPTTKTGMAFATLSISAPRSLPSGSGPVAPSLDANAPGFIGLEDWSNPQSPKLVDKIPLDTRAEDFVYQDSELASEIGDVRITQSSKTIIFGQFEFGVTMFSVHGGLNLDTPGTPVHQVVVAHKPYKTWPSYPFMDTFRRDRDTTFPKPYKLKIYKSDGTTVIKTIEMRDGLPINSPSLAQAWGPGITKPLRPHMQCGQWHFWQSAKLKYSSNASKYFSGITAQSTRESLAKQGSSCNALINQVSNRAQWNSSLHYFAAPEWPIQWSNAYGSEPALDQYDTFDDPYLYDIRTYHADEGKCGRISGWNVEPGSMSLHDWFCGPGGPRHDRSALTTPLVRYFTNPNGVRLKGNVPNRTLLDAYNHGYFHHSHHMLMADVKKFSMLSKDFVRYGQIAWANAYYGQTGVIAYVPGGTSRHIDLWGIPNQEGWRAPVRDGHKGFWNGWETDDNHSYYAPAMATIFCNSPAHTVSGTLRLYAHIAAQLGSAPPSGSSRSNFMTRVQAWRFLQLVVAWKVATNHVMGIDRETIEARYQAELEAIYDNVYVPAMINNDPAPEFVGIRRFGQPADLSYGDSNNGLSGKKWFSPRNDTKAGYYAGVLALMRQTGCWAAMRARSTKCDTVLRFLVDCMDRDTTMSIYYTKGNYDANRRVSEYANTAGTPQADASGNLPDPVLYNDWNDWVTHNPQNGQETMMTDVNGAATASKMFGTTALRLQWVFVRRDFFPEIPSPIGNNGENIVNVACAMAQSWLDGLETKINSITSTVSKSNNDMPFCYPPHGVYKAPTTLGPF